VCVEWSGSQRVSGEGQPTQCAASAPFGFEVSLGRIGQQHRIYRPQLHTDTQTGCARRSNKQRSMQLVGEFRLHFLPFAKQLSLDMDDLWCRARAAAKWSRCDELAAARQVEEAHRKRVSGLSVHVRTKTPERKAGHSVWVEAPHRPRALSGATLRHALRHEELVRDQLSRWWGMATRSCCPPEVDGPEATDTINYVPFLQLMLCIRKALLPPPFDVQRARDEAQADWVRLAGPRGTRSLSRLKFHSVLFDLADGRCMSTSPVEYVHAGRTLPRFTCASKRVAERR